jgi:hypothetical protein
MRFKVILRSKITVKTVVVVLEALSVEQAKETALAQTGKPDDYRVSDVRELESEQYS